MDAYVYKQLAYGDSFRLLELQPGEARNALEARLLDVRLSDDPTFAALSYCWGDPLFNTRLTCDGQMLLITESLTAALIHLRNASQTLVIWVDQVCIDQKNIVERAVQVTLMGQIYTKAERVLIWLGEEDADSTPGLRIVERLSKAQLRRDQNGDTRNKYQLLMSGFSEYNLPYQDDIAYSSFLRLSQRPYFSRGWILQEAVLARKSMIHCGSHSFAFDDYYRALVCCFVLGFEDNMNTDNLMRFMSLIGMRQAFKNNRKEELLTLLYQTRSTITTDPKDKIYCLLGLAGDADTLKIQPNYDASYSFQDAYRDVAITFMQSSKNLDVLSVPRTNHDSSFPSWVPDWRPASSYMLSLTARERLKDTRYRATGHSEACIQIKEDGSLLGLSGHRIDQIEECGDVYRYEESTAVQRSYWRQLRENYMFALRLRLRYIDWKHIAGVYTKGEYVSGGTKDDAFWRTLIAGHPIDSDTDFDQIRSDYRAWNSSILRFSSMRRWVPHTVLVALVTMKIVLEGLRTLLALTCFLPLYDRSHEPFNALVQCVAQRKLFRTSAGYVGLAPESVRAGDTIALFQGGRLPLIIRQHGDRWRLIGDCYVHGLMNGEKFDAQKCDTMWIE
tara:strand:+ start:5213 stop:7060 length:1848 start_codon:yes stop_codon:yes gene_type:complete